MNSEESYIMQKFKAIAISTNLESRKTDHGVVKIQNLRVHFPSAGPPYLLDETLPKTYRSKPLVVVNGDVLFGELAILRYLQMDGWDGVWVDTFHGRGRKKVFWSDMPPSGHGKLSKDAEELYEQIVQANNGKSSGFFDVFCWKDGRFVFIEYKGKGDFPNPNEIRWINAAVKCGIKQEDLFFVSY